MAPRSASATTTVAWSMRDECASRRTSRATTTSLPVEMDDASPECGLATATTIAAMAPTRTRITAVSPIYFKKNVLEVFY